MELTFGLHTFATFFMFCVTYYAWRQNMYFIWYASRMQAWMEGTYKILYEADFTEDAYRLWTKDKPTVDMWFDESDNGRFPCLLMLASTLLLMILVPVGLSNWFVALVACFSASAAVVVAKTLWIRKQIITGMYMGYQATLDAVETLAETSDDQV